MEAFRIAVPEAVIDDLHRRLEGAILPEQTPGPDWSEGIPPSVLRSLVERWRALDWRAVEERLNAYAQAVATVDGCRIHLVHVRSAHPERLPVVLTTAPPELSAGWPSSR